MTIDIITENKACDVVNLQNNLTNQRKIDTDISLQLLQAGIDDMYTILEEQSSILTQEKYMLISIMLESLHDAVFYEE